MLVNSLLLILAAIGHLGIWVVAFNQIQATAWPRFLRKGSEKLIVLIVLGLPIWILIRLFSGTASFNEPLDFYKNSLLVFGYALFCWASFAMVVIFWISRRFKYSNTAALLTHTVERVDVAAKLGLRPLQGRLMRFLNAIPGNTIFEISLEEKTIHLPKLPAELDELSITHLTDFHFTGATTPPFFEYIVDRANRFGSDLILITGDILDEPQCADWIDEILSQLSAPLGVYFVLGNHDLRVQPVSEIRQRLRSAGLVGLNGRWHTVMHRGQPIHLCGNELPWFSEAKSLSKHPETQPESGIRILLSHSPDQFYWARKYQIDLVFAGHTHGGQVRLPIYGSIVAASKYGNAFSAGVFQENGIVMQVSRGLSSTQPLRLNCPPELTKVILRRERIVGNT